MGRRKKGRDISGWVVVDKPAGVTSTAVVNKLRWAFDAKKAGHAGTLDPDATGLLPVALGEATKTIAYLGDALKAYDLHRALGVGDHDRRRLGRGDRNRRASAPPRTRSRGAACSSPAISAGAAAVLGGEGRWRARL
jgi:hypothetical protein